MEVWSLNLKRCESIFTLQCLPKVITRNSLINIAMDMNNRHTPSSKAHRLLTSCSLWLNTSCRTSITLCRIFSISVTLCIRTQKIHGQHLHICFILSHCPLHVKSASPAAKDLHHHELGRDKKLVEGGRYVCTLHSSLWVKVLGSMGLR